MMLAFCACGMQDSTTPVGKTDNAVQNEVEAPVSNTETAAAVETVTAIEEKKEERVDPSKDPKDVDAIAADLSASVSFFYGVGEYTIDSAEIVKRQTTPEDKTDLVFVDVTATRNDGSIKAEGSYKLLYVLYNEGWLLEETEVLSESSYPVAGTDYGVDVLENILIGEGYSGITNISVYDHTFQNDPNAQGIDSVYVDTYSLTATDEHIFMTEELDVSISFMYDFYAGWTPDSHMFYVNNSSETWDVVGEYSAEPLSDDYRANISAVSVIEFDTISGSVTTQENPNEGTYLAVEKELRYVGDLSFEEALEDAIESKNNDRLEEVRGYNFYLTNGDWSQILYTSFQVFNPMDRTQRGIYVGKDHIYWGLWNITDYYNREIDYEFQYELFRIDR